MSRIIVRSVTFQTTLVDDPIRNFSGRVTSIWNNKCLIKRNVSKIPNTDVVTNLPVYDLTLSKALSIEICLHKGYW